jgi:perosamine synthetase
MVDARPTTGDGLGGRVNVKPAINGGSPVRDTLLPYGRQAIDDVDIAAVVDVLRSDWLTTGPKVDDFEAAIALVAGTKYAVAVSSGTAALHASMYAMGVGPGDEIIVPTMTFAASANCAVYQGATPIFADVDPTSLLLDLASAESKITTRTKAILAVDYAGQPCDYDGLKALCGRYGLSLLADACHAIGGSYKGAPVGSLADLSTFSFHPVKHVTSGEGGAVTTDDPNFARSIRAFRNHGIATDHRQRAKNGEFYYEMTDVGYNYRLSDIQCALGQSQLAKLAGFVARRQQIAARYDDAFASIAQVTPLTNAAGVSNAYHLYVIQLDLRRLKADRAGIYRALRAENIGINVHYLPVHLHPLYRERFETGPGMCPVAEDAYERILSLPIFPAMADTDVADVIQAVSKIMEYYRG